MFGYIQTCKEELKVREFEAYKGIYCSLCRQMGKEYGLLTRFSLSYDFTFYALLRMAREERCAGFRKGRCVFNPLAKCRFLKETSASLSLAAGVAVILVYYSIKDKLRDQAIKSRIKAAAAYLPFARAHRKARKKHPELERIAAQIMTQQAQLENDRCESLDKAADPTARLLGALFSYGEESESDRRIFQRFGYCMGKWVYLMDALDDLEEDRKSGDYNPFLLAYAGQSMEELRENARALLNVTMAEAAAAMELAEYRRFKPIIDNVIYLGSVQMRDKVFNQEKKK